MPKFSPKKRVKPKTLVPLLPESPTVVREIRESETRAVFTGVSVSLSIGSSKYQWLRKDNQHLALISTTTNNLDLDKGEFADGILLDDDSSEPTIGEELARPSLPDKNKFWSDKEEDYSVRTKPPSADSVLVLLAQALNADDRTLLLDCLYTQDEKVIAKSIAQLNPSNVLKLLHSLISISESRGAILNCALPWLKCLLLQHASGIMSQEYSLHTLNSLYQLIESRVSTFKSAVHLSSCLDILYTTAVDEEVDEVQTLPIIYEDDSEEESRALETEQNGNYEEQSDEACDGVSDTEESGDMMSE